MSPKSMIMAVAAHCRTWVEGWSLVGCHLELLELHTWNCPPGPPHHAQDPDVLVLVGPPTYADEESGDGGATSDVDHGQQTGQMALSGTREAESGVGDRDR